MKKSSLLILGLVGLLTLSACTKGHSGKGPDKTKTQTTAGVHEEKGFTIDEDGTVLAYAGAVKDLTIPDTIAEIKVRRIGKEAFKNKGISKLAIPPSVIEIGKEAFADNDLISLDFPRDLALALALDPSLASYKEKHIEISLEDRGACIVGFGPANTRVYTSLDPQAFFDFFTNILRTTKGKL